MKDSYSSVTFSKNKFLCGESSMCDETDLTKHENCKKVIQILVVLGPIVSIENEFINCCMYSATDGGEKKVKGIKNGRQF